MSRRDGGKRRVVARLSVPAWVGEHPYTLCVDQEGPRSPDRDPHIQTHSIPLLLYQLRLLLGCWLIRWDDDRPSAGSLPCIAGAVAITEQRAIVLLFIEVLIVIRLAVMSL